ncbi:MAG: type II toxin-antitoxin system PemK/MazF family toxin [Chloroflexi bacterium]|nr:type II toxin-antitoxin system PemK/MazF family toxin [Chloroflexota bacterium]
MIRRGPLRGEIWLIDFNPIRGREQAGTRPGMVVSVDLFNRGPAGLVVVLPLTTRPKGVPLHVEVNAPEGSLRERSFIKCEDVRSVSTERLIERWGAVGASTVLLVEDRLRLLLGL